MVKGHNLAHCGGDLVVQESFFNRIGVKAGQLWGVMGGGGGGGGGGGVGGGGGGGDRNVC